MSYYDLTLRFPNSGKTNSLRIEADSVDEVKTIVNSLFPEATILPVDSVSLRMTGEESLSRNDIFANYRKITDDIGEVSLRIISDNDAKQGKLVDSRGTTLDRPIFQMMDLGESKKILKAATGAGVGLGIGTPGRDAEAMGELKEKWQRFSSPDYNFRDEGRYSRDLMDIFDEEQRAGATFDADTGQKFREFEDWIGQDAAARNLEGRSDADFAMGGQQLDEFGYPIGAVQDTTSRDISQLTDEEMGNMVSQAQRDASLAQGQQLDQFGYPIGIGDPPPGGGPGGGAGGGAGGGSGAGGDVDELGQPLGTFTGEMPNLSNAQRKYINDFYFKQNPNVAGTIHGYIMGLNAFLQLKDTDKMQWGWRPDVDDPDKNGIGAQEKKIGTDEATAKMMEEEARLSAERTNWGEAMPEQVIQRQLEGMSPEAAFRRGLQQRFGDLPSGSFQSFMQRQSSPYAGVYTTRGLAGLRDTEIPTTFQDYVSKTDLPTMGRHATEALGQLRGYGPMEGAESEGLSAMLRPQGVRDLDTAMQLLTAAQRSKYSPMVASAFNPRGIYAEDLYADYLAKGGGMERSPSNFLDFASGRYGL